MRIDSRAVLLISALTVGLSQRASAQALATFGAVEADGFGEGSALLGTSISTGHAGWGLVANLIGQTYRYVDSPTSHAQAYTISPSLGLQRQVEHGSVNAMVGYTFVNTEFASIISGAQQGGQSGTFVSAQGNYWGTGENEAQFIGAYQFNSEYYWTRGRASHRLAERAQPIYVGGELIFQGTPKTRRNGAFTIPSQFRYQVGPTIEYRFSQAFRLGASAGLRAGNNNASTSGYARLEFLLLNTL